MKMKHDYPAVLSLRATSHVYLKKKKYTKLMKHNPEKKVPGLKPP